MLRRLYSESLCLRREKKQRLPHLSFFEPAGLLVFLGARAKGVYIFMFLEPENRPRHFSKSRRRFLRPLRLYGKNGRSEILLLLRRRRPERSGKFFGGGNILQEPNFGKCCQKRSRENNSCASPSLMLTCIGALQHIRPAPPSPRASSKRMPPLFFSGIFAKPLTASADSIRFEACAPQSFSA